MPDLSAIDLTDDPLARQCITLRDNLRRLFAEARHDAAQWTPRPCPPKAGRRG